MSITLVAISGMADVFFSRDDAGTYRRHCRYLPGDPVEVGAAEVDRVVSDFGYRRVDKTFDSWLELGRYAEEQVPKTGLTVGELPISAAFARMAIPGLRRHARDPRAATNISLFVARLMLSDSVRSDPALMSELSSLLKQSAMAQSASVVSFPNGGRSARLGTASTYFASFAA